MDDQWRCVWSAPRPFVHPLRAQNGARLTVDAPADHPWHHGLWFAIKFVNGENFWEEYGDFGVLEAREISGDERAVRAEIDWRRPNGAVVVEEQRVLTYHDLEPGAYALDWEVSLRPVDDVVFDRTPFTTWGGYGGLTLRGAPDWTDTVLTIEGGERPRLLGERAPWCALDGIATTDDGRRVPAGVVLLDDARNVGHPTPWYASTRADTYGDGWANFVNAAFLWDGSMPVAAGEVLVRRHRVIVHSEIWSSDDIQTAVARMSP